MSKYIKRIPRVPAKSYRRFRKTWEDMGVKPIKYFDLSSGDLSWLSQSVSGKLVDKCLDGISDRVDGIDDRTRQRFKEYAGNRSLAEKLINLAKYKEESLKGVDSMAGLMTYLKNQIIHYRELLEYADLEMRKFARYVGYLDGFGLKIETALLENGLDTAFRKELREKYHLALRKVGESYKKALDGSLDPEAPTETQTRADEDEL